ncbi:hypothetical protein B0T14DRAFT_501286 [Immersiella caudata]|uniref:Uncharacterized protein n=1 Tax=Immersiella caudata TaxID=314043 RepID=A0AA39XD44_9PEZI|nr:hypothetical protein B0T14DRAFT_501286 [Immersiella caudata]
MSELNRLPQWLARSCLTVLCSGKHLRQSRDGYTPRQRPPLERRALKGPIRLHCGPGS